jgi:hypothetical protein
VYSVITSYNDLSPYNYKSESFHDNFFQQGTSDKTNLLVLKQAVEFYNRMGGLVRLLWFKHILFINGFGKAKMLHQPSPKWEDW